MQTRTMKSYKMKGKNTKRLTYFDLVETVNQEYHLAQMMLVIHPHVYLHLYIDTSMPMKMQH
jgi:hypothetical protein